MPVCNSALWLSVKELLGRSWFERLWIWQEVHLAENDMSFLCGDIEIDFQHFCNAIKYFYKHRLDLPGLNRAHRIARQRFKKAIVRTTDLVYLTRSCKCSDERDRVYALLNLTNKDHPIDVLPNYMKSVQEVFQTLVIQQLESEFHLGLLELCSLGDRSSNLPTWLNWSMPIESPRLKNGRAAAGTRAQAYCPGEGVLVAAGVVVSTIAQVKLGSGTGSNNDFSGGSAGDHSSRAKAVAKLLREVTGSLDIAIAGPIIESVCRSINFFQFSEDFVPPRIRFWNFQEVVKVFTNCWKWSFDENTKSGSKYHKDFIYDAYDIMRARTVFTTANGLLGIGPQGMRAEDKLCVIFGCQNPLILRHQRNQHYQIVGVCCIDGIMKGEALLGPLPNSWKYIRKWYPELKDYNCAFLNQDTKETQIQDPRLGSLPTGWRIKRHSNQDSCNWYVNDETGEDTGKMHPGLKIDALKARGITFEEFRIV